MALLTVNDMKKWDIVTVILKYLALNFLKGFEDSASVFNY